MRLLTSIREFFYLLRKGVFVVQMYNYHTEQFFDGSKIHTVKVMDGRPLYLNAKGDNFSFTHSTKGATTCTLIAGWILCRALRKHYPHKAVELVTVQDVAFVNYVQGND